MTGRRQSQASLERLLSHLSSRDRAILSDLDQVRVLTGAQLTRLHFSALSPSTRDRVRRRVLSRLTAWGLAVPLERRIGGVRAGSSGVVYALGTAGQRLLPLLDAESTSEPPKRARRPWTPGALFLAHSLDVSELYVQLREHELAGRLTLQAFAAEPASWYPTGFGGHLKPDAFAVVQGTRFDDSVWVEVDRATESLPTLRRKLLGYVDFALSGQPGPDGVVPRVLVTVPHERRRTAVLDLIVDLPEPAAQLIRTQLMSEAVPDLVKTLEKW